MAVPLVFVLFVGAAITLVVVVGVLSYLSAKKRRETLALLASQRGWTYVERDDRWVDQFDGAPFGTGHDRRADNVMTGTYDGRPMVAFDYRYSTTETSTDAEGHTQTHTEVHPFSVLALNSGARFPELSVTPEGFFGRMVGRLTNTDIELESEQFNRAFTVRSADRKFATDVLHPRMMEFLLQIPDRGWTLRAGWLVAARPGRHSVEQLDARLADLDGILDRIPDFVWKARGGQGGASPEPPRPGLQG
jgi:Protein of unknown function (DUF3137)